MASSPLFYSECEYNCIELVLCYMRLDYFQQKVQYVILMKGIKAKFLSLHLLLQVVERNSSYCIIGSVGRIKAFSSSIVQYQPILVSN